MVGDYATYGVRTTLHRYVEAMLAAGRIHNYPADDAAKAVGRCHAADMAACTAFVPCFARANACGKVVPIVCFGIPPEDRVTDAASALIGQVCAAARTAGCVPASARRFNFASPSTV